MGNLAMELVANNADLSMLSSAPLRRRRLAIPEDVIKKGREEILSWLAAASYDAVCSFKVLVLGHARAGKVGIDRSIS
jgi:hypothetical protein